MNSLGSDFDTVLTRAAVGVLAAAGVWVLLVVLSVAVEARTSGRTRLARSAGCPPRLRRWLLGVFLVSLSGVAAPAGASTAGSGSGPASEPGDGDRAVVTVLDGLPLPDRTNDRPEDHAEDHAEDHPVDHAVRARAQRPEVVVVRAGDSLWRIARAALPDGAPDSVVAAAVARVYADNRHVIGDDPDLILPGEHLAIDLRTSTSASASATTSASTPLREDR